MRNNVLPVALLLPVLFACGSGDEDEAGGSQDASGTWTTSSTGTSEGTSSSGTSDGDATEGTETSDSTSSSSSSSSSSTSSSSSAETGTDGSETTTGDDATGETTTSSSTTDGDTGDDTGTSTGDTTDSDGDTDTDGVQCGDLLITVRDFNDDHPDFETFTGSAAFTGIVEDELDGNRKPVYAHPGGTAQTTGPTEFLQWYNDDPVNMKVETTIALEELMPGVFTYSNSEFFPADNLGWGNDGRDHNFHFTTEIHTQFRYNGGEEFTFTGDDDLWLFINGRLAIDLGGLHSSLSETIVLDDLAADLGIVVGQKYPLEVFHAERHTNESNFRIDTTIDCFEPPPQ